MNVKKRFVGILVTIAMIALVGALAWNAAAQTRVPITKTVSSVQTQGENEATTDLSRTITVVGKGSVKIKPDIATVNLGVQTFGPSVKTATTDAAKAMEAVLAALKKQGVAEKDIQTSGYSVWADTGYGPDRRPDEEVTYRVNNNVSVVVRDLDSLGTVLDAAIEAGANTIHGISFGLAEPEKLESQARELAVENALAKAQELAKLHGLAVGPVVSVSEVISGGYMASNFMRLASDMGYGGGAGPVNPGELELSMQLQVVYAIR